MRRSKEIMLLLALLVSMMAFVLWYVIARRAKMHAAPTPTVTQAPAATTAPAASSVTVGPPTAPLNLEVHDGQTIDFSSGKAVVTDSPEDRVKMAKALKEMEEAAKSVTFERPTRKPDPPKPPADKP